jgi:Flp pilus assembly protein TadG
MLPLLVRLRAERSGASAMELALSVPVMLLMLLPAIDFGLAFSAKMRLTAAATRSAELATGAGRVMPSYDFLTTEAEAAAGTDTAEATVNNWLECAGAVQNDVTGACDAGVRYARYVQVVVEDEYEPLFTLGGFTAAPVDIQGSATLRVQ